MNNEETERKMSFIVEQQAQFADDIQQLKEVQVQTENVVGRLALRPSRVLRMYDEIRLSDRGYVLHEIELSCGSHWLIECRDVQAHGTDSR